MLKTRTFVAAAAALCAGAGCSIAIADEAGENPVQITIDFEGLPESTPINNQYAEFGVTFSLGGSKDFPIIATEGAPATAFGGYDGSFDTPFVSGRSGLTDPPGASVITSNDILIHFAKPAQNVRLWVIDIDGGHGENWTDRCQVAGADSSGIVLDMMTLDAEDPGTGDLAHTLFELVAPEGSEGIYRVAIDVTQNMGFAIDDLTFTLMPDPDVEEPGGGEEEENPGGGGNPEGEEPPSTGNPNGTPGVFHTVRPIGQTSINVTADNGVSFLTSEPDGGETFAVVPFDDGEFGVDLSLLPCGVPVYWAIVGEGPRGNTVRVSSKLDPIVRRPFGDLTIDGVIDAADLGVMINSFIEQTLVGDLNGDGITDAADLGLLISVYGSTCQD